MPMQLYKPEVCLSGIGKGNARGAHDMSTGILWLGKVQRGPNHTSVHLHPEHAQKLRNAHTRTHLPEELACLGA